MVTVQTHLKNRGVFRNNAKLCFPAKKPSCTARIHSLSVLRTAKRIDSVKQCCRRALMNLVYTELLTGIGSYLEERFEERDFNE